MIVKTNESRKIYTYPELFYKCYKTRNKPYVHRSSFQVEASFRFVLKTLSPRRALDKQMEDPKAKYRSHEKPIITAAHEIFLKKGHACDTVTIVKPTLSQEFAVFGENIEFNTSLHYISPNQTYVCPSNLRD
jgi:hypothetical protein